MGVRSYVEPVRSRRFAQPPLPHRGYRIGVRYDDNLPRLTGGNRYPWWGDGGGYALTSSRSVVEGAPSHAYPTMDTASGCGTTVGGYRIGVRYDDYLLRLTGGNRYPWWGDGGGYALTSSRSVVEGAPSHPYPTMGTASECGTTTTSLVLPVETGIHVGVTVGGTLLRRAGPWSKVRPATLTPPLVPHRGAVRRCGVSGPEYMVG